jgi:DNA-binding MarR family transcriptional regulator
MKSPRTVDPRVLASPLRAEIIGHLQTDGPQSIRELAARLARPASGLYHHVRLLERSGLLVEKERRKSGRREEVVYALTAPRAAIRDARDPTRRAGIAAAATAALRLAGREFTAALDACPAGRHPRVRLSRQRVWLSDAGARRANALLRRLEALLAAENRRRRGRLHVVTTIFVPLARR